MTQIERHVLMWKLTPRYLILQQFFTSLSVEISRVVPGGSSIFLPGVEYKINVIS